MFRRKHGYLSLIVALLATGCGPSLHPVEGVLNMDGAPVADASITFVSEDGNKTYNAKSDAQGKFSLATDNKSGIVAGKYKVLVVKYAQTPVAENLTPSDPEYFKQMEKNKKDAEKASKAAATPPPVSGGSGMGMRPPGSMMPGVSTAPPPPKSELPALYASVTTTPISVSVPLEKSPVPIDIKKDAASTKK